MSFPRHREERPTRRSALLPLAIALSCAACATSPESPPPPQAATAEPVVEVPGGSTIERGPLGPLVRDFGQRFEHNLVLMNGLEYQFAGPYNLDELTPDVIPAKIAEDAGLALTRLPAYDFIHPPGYESLTTFSPSMRLDRRVANATTSLRIGADTPLFGALALLSHSHEVTLVADNVVASALCGELSLHDVDFGDALNAVMQSARLTDVTCAIRAEDGAVFFFTPRAEPRSRLLMSATRPRALDREVTLYLPEAPRDSRRLLETPGAVPLAECARSIGEQLGMRVEIDQNCQQLPVNPAVMIGVTMETAMRLLIQQWPLPHYGYTATEDTIRIVYLGPPTD